MKKLRGQKKNCFSIQELDALIADGKPSRNARKLSGKNRALGKQKVSKEVAALLPAIDMNKIPALQNEAASLSTYLLPVVVLRMPVQKRTHLSKTSSSTSQIWFARPWRLATGVSVLVPDRKALHEVPPSEKYILENILNLS